MDSLYCRGFCIRCHEEHVLPAAPAVSAARALLAELEQWGNIGLDVSDDQKLDLSYLYGSARGQMFGVMTYLDAAGRGGVLRAFSGQYNGIWEVPGWVGPILDPIAFVRTVEHDEPRIKDMTRRMEGMPRDDPQRSDLLAARRELSQDLMGRIFELYRLSNFRGQTRSLAEAFYGRAMPSGTGECCAPKLLHHAATHGLTPVGLAEFYVGRENRSGTRRHGEFYAPCAEKCMPILGFLLCGMDG